MPHKSETERPLKLEDGLYIFEEPHTHVTKKNRHRHIKDDKKKKPVPVNTVHAIYIDETTGGKYDVPDRL